MASSNACLPCTPHPTPPLQGLPWGHHCPQRCAHIAVVWTHALRPAAASAAAAAGGSADAAVSHLPAAPFRIFGPRPPLCAVMYYTPQGTNLTGIPLTQVCKPLPCCCFPSSCPAAAANSTPKERLLCPQTATSPLAELGLLLARPAGRAPAGAGPNRVCFCGSWLPAAGSPAHGMGWHEQVGGMHMHLGLPAACPPCTKQSVPTRLQQLQICSEIQPLRLTLHGRSPMFPHHPPLPPQRGAGPGRAVAGAARLQGAGRAHGCRPAGCTCTLRLRLLRRGKGVAALSHHIITAGKCLTHALLGCLLPLSRRQM